MPHAAEMVDLEVGLYGMHPVLKGNSVSILDSNTVADVEDSIASVIYCSMPKPATIRDFN